MRAVVAQRAGELLTDEALRRVEVKADRDELAVTQSRYAEEESGPDAHFHREHSDCFFVLEGRLVFEFDHERTEATPAASSPCRRWSCKRSATRAPATRASSTSTLPAMASSSTCADAGDPDRFDTYDPSARYEGS